MVSETNFKMVVNGQDVTANIKPYLHAISITDNHSDQADSLSLTVSAKFARPAYDDKIKIYLGRGDSLTFLGLFHVQSTTIRDNRELTINATGVNYSSSIKQRYWASYDISLTQLITNIAKRHGLAHKIELSEPVNQHFEQRGESDTAFLNRLAKQYNCIFNIKNDTLYFVQDEQQAPEYTIDINKCLSSEITYGETSYYASSKAVYHCTKQNKIIEQWAGGGEPILAVEGQWHTAEEAREAAQKALEKANKAQVQGRLSVAGQVIFAGGILHIDGDQHQITKVTHNVQPAWVTDVEFSAKKDKDTNT